jgi:uncharacterized protein
VTPGRPVQHMEHMAAGLLACVLTMVLASCGSRAGKPEFPPTPTRFVTDNAGVLGNRTDVLEAKLKAFEQDTSNQVVVWTDARLPEGYDILAFSVEAFERWKIGQADKDNGILFVIFPEDRETRIEVGYGLEGALPDALAGRIIQEQAIPSFRVQDYAGGIEKSVDGILAATRGEYEGPGAPAGGGSGQASRNPDAVNLPVWVIPAIFFVVIGLVILQTIRRIRYGIRTYGPSGWYRPFILTGGSSGRSGGSSGGGGWGGGFSGGGGSSGGGGASGSW